MMLVGKLWMVSCHGKHGNEASVAVSRCLQNLKKIRCPDTSRLYGMPQRPMELDLSTFVCCCCYRYMTCAWLCVYVLGRTSSSRSPSGCASGNINIRMWLMCVFHPHILNPSPSCKRVYIQLQSQGIDPFSPPVQCMPGFCSTLLTCQNISFVVCVFKYVDASAGVTQGRDQHISFLLVFILYPSIYWFMPW